MLSKILPQNKTALLCLLFAITSASIITANLCTIKMYDFFGMALAGGISTIVIDYVCSDVAVEIFGFKTAIRMRRAAMILNVAAFALLNATVYIAPHGEFTLQSEYASIFTAAPIMVVASAVAYMAGTWVNDKMMQIMKEKDGEKGLFKRCLSSTIVGDAIDAVLFTVIAYGGFYSLFASIETTLLTFVLKIAVETVTYALITRHVIKWAKTLD